MAIGAAPGLNGISGWPMKFDLPESWLSTDPTLLFSSGMYGSVWCILGGRAPRSDWLCMAEEYREGSVDGDDGELGGGEPVA